ncbi:hypothetical protein TVAG_335550 [Trichomonas vaginalis G3]|uniref:Uncharacterized protein n=1 Tax=Trichomonas vaginalis (strain ATCC PRA-98 / G3) TaxID=412133 RepID=A2FC82_TRIV3|nr:hypothetical protein TVAGG3_0147910 [Trichomonas vaginalis G3]EAX97495.1 hypothetical protein TVAG_335550 [Trichomonas vaginalis G3]KAI5547065.1 hypothetical protein TVAGG3_0147910 [Trichomonas vaginalis G3]|eukprot:XP_001310425.1 hypothetical protein [Trichomonas vaginalis G3]
MAAPENSTAMMRFVLQRLEKKYNENLDDEHFEAVSPGVNFNRKKIVNKAETKIEITKDDIPKPYKSTYVLSPEALQKVELEKNVPEVEYKFQFVPEKLEAKPMQIPADFGRDYLQEQLVDLTFQFSRLSMPVCE